MDRTDARLRELFAVDTPPGLGRRLREALRNEPATLETLLGRFHVQATERGVSRLAYGRGRDVAAGRGRRHAEQARHELGEYLGGRRTFFTVPVDLAGVGEFQERVLAEAERIPFGEVTSYSTLARRIGHPQAARAVDFAQLGNVAVVIEGLKQAGDGALLDGAGVQVGGLLGDDQLLNDLFACGHPADA